MERTVFCEDHGNLVAEQGECPKCRHARLFPISTKIVAEGKKFDTDKLDWSVVDLAFIEPLIPVFKLGEKRYGFLNWSKPFDNSNRRFYSATMRHMKAAQYDPLAINEEDDNVYHLAQVAWDALQRLSQALKEKEKK